MESIRGMTDCGERPVRNLNRGRICIVEIESVPCFASSVLAINHLENELEIVTVVRLCGFDF